MLLLRKEKSFLYLLAILTVVSIAGVGITFTLLSRAALREERTRLAETAQSQARLIEAVARFDQEFSSDFPGAALEATLSQIREAHSNYQGFGETGELLLADLVGEQIVFLLSQRHQDLADPQPIPWDSPLAEPMRLALSGQSGTIIGPDYRGVTVLAAYEPVAILDLGIVAKVDMAEIRAPFIRAGIITGLLTLLMLGVGAFFFIRISSPIIRQLEDQSKNLESQVEARTRELNEAQETLIRQERLAALGELAGGIGHELRHPLGVITNSIYYLKLIREDASNEESEYLDLINKEAMKAGKITSDLLSFARGKEPQKTDVPVFGLIQEAMKNYPPPTNVEVNLPPKDGLMVHVDPHQITQVLNNLFVNAFQAMPDGGKLVVQKKKEENQVKILIIDTGSGMSEETKANLFQPLFTTKSRGIGLGLAVSKKYVEANGGSISVESTEGFGTTFTLLLPTGSMDPD